MGRVVIALLIGLVLGAIGALVLPDELGISTPPTVRTQPVADGTTLSGVTAEIMQDILTQNGIKGSVEPEIEDTQLVLAETDKGRRYFVLMQNCNAGECHFLQFAAAITKAPVELEDINAFNFEYSPGKVYFDLNEQRTLWVEHGMTARASVTKAEIAHNVIVFQDFMELFFKYADTVERNRTSSVVSQLDWRGLNEGNVVLAGAGAATNLQKRLMQAYPDHINRRGP